MGIIIIIQMEYSHYKEIIMESLSLYLIYHYKDMVIHPILGIIIMGIKKPINGYDHPLLWENKPLFWPWHMHTGLCS